MSRKAARASIGAEPCSSGKTNISMGTASCGKTSPSRWGGPLSESDYATLESSWITREIADQAMLRRVDAEQGRELVGQKRRDCAGLLIPYHWPGGRDAFNYRVRRDTPDWVAGSDGKPKLDRKYLGPPNSANRLYIPPPVRLDQLQDSSVPIAIVEGEKKSLALWHLANHETERLRFVPIGLAGVWNWRGRIGKTGGPKGERLDVRGPIPDLSRIEWKSRKVFIVFDTNVHTNESVKAARRGICRELATRGAEVQLVNLPDDCGVNGVDDLLAKCGPERVLELFDKSESVSKLSVVLPPQFQARPDGMFRISASGERLTQTQLTNYQASITANVRLDDGVETRLELEMECELMTRRFRFTLPASEFQCMDWPIKHMGSGAINYPNQKEYARAAIQSLSINAEERCIYTHTGWRTVDSHRIFLHAGGSIGADGAGSDCRVRLAGAMSRYELRLPSGPETLKAAIKASLQLIELAPSTISFPLLAATYRAVLGQADFAVHLTGATGAFKSELAALYQQHFGAGMDRLHLPAAWASTANSLEILAFQAKDALLVVDDFAPQGNGADVARYHAAADRIFRAAGNQAGRNRLDSTANLREAKPPRALLLSTGEEIPRGQSVRARLLILELTKGDIDATTLTECQSHARAGLYAEAMGGFVQWLAGEYEDLKTKFDQLVCDHRAAARCGNGHARTPEILANLQAAFELFSEFALTAGAISSLQKDRLSAACWEALRSIAADQAKHQGETEPTARYIEILRSALTSGRAHLAERTRGLPKDFHESCGWRRADGGSWNPLGECIGWIDADTIYLDPTAAYTVVQKSGRDSGEVLAVSEQTLRKRLHERRLLASTDQSRETLTVRRSICGSSRSVLHFLRSTILPEASDNYPADTE